MIIEKIESILLRTPGVKKIYADNAALWKRSTCLALDRLGLLKPFSFVQWLVTFGCNLSCPFCEASAGKPAPDELTTEEGLALIDDLADMGVHRLIFSGGEPLSRRDILILMRHAHDRGLRIGLVTNGYFTGELWPDVKNLRIFLYFTSLDGPSRYHNRIRGNPQAWSRAMDGLSRAAENRIPVRMINTVITRSNIGLLDSIHALAASTGATHWRLTPLVRIGRASEKPDDLISCDELGMLISFIRNSTHSRLRIDLGESHTILGRLNGVIPGKPFFCGAGLTRCAVMPDGTVLGCHQVYDNAFSEGNIRSRPFSQIWKHAFTRFRSPVTDHQCLECIHLNACQGGCWAQRMTEGSCLKTMMEGGKSCSCS